MFSWASPLTVMRGILVELLKVSCIKEQKLVNCADQVKMKERSILLKFAQAENPDAAEKAWKTKAAGAMKKIISNWDNYDAWANLGAAFLWSFLR
jgi:hypothetical protein